MSFFEKPGELDENSFWYAFHDKETKALDQAAKARTEVAKLRASAAAAEGAPDASRLRTLELHVLHIEQRMMALGLYARTILQLLYDKGLLDPEEFAKRLEEIDLLDGKLDGR